MLTPSFLHDKFCCIVNDFLQASCYTPHAAITHIFKLLWTLPRYCKLHVSTLKYNLAHVQSLSMGMYVCQ